jgi:hypothetical protein
MVNNTGLGNSNECLLPNTWSENEKLNSVVKEMLTEALKLKSIQEYGGFDFEVESYGDGFTINFGLEPTYQYEPLLLYHIENDKDNCKTIKGKAQGVYGSNIEINKEIKYDNCDTEFKELIERWHKKLLEVA